MSLAGESFADFDLAGAPTHLAPAIRFTGGSPTDLEVAAVTAILLTQAGHVDYGQDDEEPASSAWARPAFVRGRYPRSWRESRLP